MFSLLEKHYGGRHRRDIGYHARVVPNAYKDWFTFGTVRNPFSRAVSVFRAFVADDTAYTRKYRVRCQLPKPTFLEFAKWLASADLSRFNYVFLSQSVWYKDARLDAVLRLESLDADVRRLPFWCGPDHFDSASNVTSKGAPPWLSLYKTHPDAEQLIGAWAQSDFELFGYSPSL